MKENDIRPDELMAENEKLFGIDVEELLQYKNKFVEIPCPACEDSNHVSEFEKNGFNFVRCKKCDTLYVNPRPTAGMLADYYSRSRSIKHWNDEIFPVSESYRRANIFTPRAGRVVEMCRKFGTDTELLMDVGAGFGTFCEEISKLGMFERVIAVEPSDDLAETCAKKGIEVIAKPIEEVEMDTVSVVTNFELIEHLFWPKDFINACSNVLISGGLFIVTTPNIKGFDLMVLGKLSDNIGAPNHLNYFHPDSLVKMLEQAGLEVVEVLTPGALDAELVRKKICSGAYDVSGNPFLKHILLDDWENKGEKFQRYLTDNRLSSHMWIVARKI